MRFFLSFLATLFIFPSVSLAASLGATPASGNFSVGQNFSVNVTVDGAGQPMNAVEASLLYDASVLSVVSVTKEGSAFSLWTTEPSANAGAITFGGGSPSPFSQKSTLVKVTFRGLKEGSGTLRVSSASVLAADGQGTDIMSQTLPVTIGTFTIAAKTEEETPSTPSTSGRRTPRAPEVISETHAEEEKWYNSNAITFGWNLPEDVTSVRVLFNKRADSTPTVVYTPPISSREVLDVDDGVSYFHIQFRNAVGWGSETHRKVQIDTQAPELAVEVDNVGEFPKLKLNATDELSGIEKFIFTIGSQEPKEVTPDLIPENVYEVVGAEGETTVLVKVLDKAGNETQVETKVTPGAPPEKKSTNIQEEEPQEEVSFVRKYATPLMAGGLILIIVLQFAYLTWERKRYRRERALAEKEALEVSYKMEKIFSALRDEVEEQVNLLNKKPRLTEAEAKMLGKLREALDISEELIQKEVEDVQKILKQ